jgi:serine/threonine-protein kinase
MKLQRWQQIERLYRDALGRPEGERTAFLRQACAGNEDLRREVESLLAQGSGTESFPETPAVEMAAFAMAQEQGLSLEGRQLGSYHVISKIGVGAMGEVYRAKDTKLRREVALKVLPPALARDPERLARSRREAQLLASLNHTNIAAIYGLEETHDPPFLVLELVEGETLAEGLVRAGPLPLQEALTFCGQMAEALEYAHKKGITHRDIKPANIKVKRAPFYSLDRTRIR